MKSYQKILISVLIGFIAFPIIGLGSSIIVSLIQGKTPTEAVQILAEQIDSLVSRVETVETKQKEQQMWQEKEDARNKARDYLDQNISGGYDYFLKKISDKEKNIVSLNEKINWPNCLCEDRDLECLVLYDMQNECNKPEDKEHYRDFLENAEKPELENLQLIRDQYLLLKQECDNLSSQYNNLYE